MTDFEINDWKKKNATLIKEMDSFDEQFRKSSNCSCEKIIFENGKTYCKHTVEARTKRFKREIENQVAFLI